MSEIGGMLGRVVGGAEIGGAELEGGWLVTPGTVSAG